MKFTIRDLVWATLVAALLLALTINYLGSQAKTRELRQQAQRAQMEREVAMLHAERAKALDEILKKSLLEKSTESVSGQNDNDQKPLVSPNKVEPTTSPSGKFTATLPIRTGKAYPKTEVWIVTIENDSDEIVYEDLASQFVGHLNVYWAWDAEDRFWLYNSDDGCIWYWQQSNGDWIKTYWGDRSGRKVPEEIEPPDSLLPDYAR